VQLLITEQILPSTLCVLHQIALIPSCSGRCN